MSDEVIKIPDLPEWEPWREPMVFMHRDTPGDHVPNESCWCRPVGGSALSEESLIPLTEECDG